MASYSPELIVAAALVAAAAGAIRGITGFGGAMVMSPPLALLLGPLTAVPIVLLLESLAAAPMLVQTRALVRWRVIGPIIAAGVLTVPLGTLALVTVDALVMRRLIAATVILFCALLLSGWRYAGAQRPGTGIGLGAISGALTGATSMGGPPVILYLLAGPDRIDTTRANLTYFVGAMTALGFVSFALSGALAWPAVLMAAFLAPGYYAGMVAGTRLFPRFDDRRFRRFTLLLLLAVALGILVA